MDVERYFTTQIATLNRLIAEHDKVIAVLESPRPAGRLILDGVWETTEEAMARVRAWRERDATSLRQVREIWDTYRARG